MMLLMDGPVTTVVNHPSVCLPGAPGGRPGGCADAEELVSAEWQAPLMEIMSGSGSAGTGTGVGPETATGSVSDEVMISMPSSKCISTQQPVVLAIGRPIWATLGATMVAGNQSVLPSSPSHTASLVTEQTNKWYC